MARGRASRLLRCFGSDAIAVTDCSCSRGGPDGPVFAYVAVGGKEGTAVPTFLSDFSGEKAVKAEDSGEVKASSRHLSRVVKAVLLWETSLAKKIRNRKSRQRLRRLNNNIASKMERIVNSMKNARPMTHVDPFPKKHDSKSYSSSHKSSSAASLSSAGATNPLPFSEPAENPTHPRQGSNKYGKKETAVESRSGSNGGLLFWLLVLVVLVMVCSGKLWAILSTSILMFGVPRCRRNPPKLPGLFERARKLESGRAGGGVSRAQEESDPGRALAGSHKAG